ncbi:MAG: thioredoxin family protein [Rhodospirillaceae bacterium]|nr:thioredoxin family protein [Rhodospirillaceae bacterium]
MAAESSHCDFGWKAKDFQLDATDGRRYSLAEIRGAKGTVVVFICNHCPYVRNTIDRILRDLAELKAEGIGAIAIMPNDVAAYPADSFDNMKNFAAQHRFGFPYAIDATQETARAYGAQCTPDFFGFNAALELHYRGRLDSAGNRPADPDTKRELVEAMRQIARTGAGPRRQVPSIGCSIKWEGE